MSAGCQRASAISFAPPEPSQITQSNVERVLATLAADDMRGRQAFTNDAMRAAEYLAQEFADAGVQALGGDYLQRFEVTTVAPGPAQVTLDGVALGADQFVVRPGSSSAQWSNEQGGVVRVGPTNDVRQLMSDVRSATEDVLVLVPSDQRELFETLARFLGRPVRSLDAGNGPSVALAIWDGAGDPSYEIEASAVVTQEPLANVVGVIPGLRADEYVLFSAHYDHIGIRPAVNGDSIGNGANDDASGTTAVVELARYFAARGTPERTLLFAAFTAEEAGGFGSRYYSSQLNPDQIVAMFNIEMIGKPAVEGPNTAWITGFERSSFGVLLQEAVEGTPYTFYPDPYPQQNLFYRSDNATLARLGVPAHSISTTPIDVDTDYHTVTDEVPTLDLEHMTNTIRAIAMGAERMVAGEATPTRVDPATVTPR
ncbi:MAG: hypothetical protein ACI9OJ_004835 [Myxococcota bacterium]|jgi:hypothetical protein